jgi:signal transduction histidine kinase
MVGLMKIYRVSPRNFLSIAYGFRVLFCRKLFLLSFMLLPAANPLFSADTSTSFSGEQYKVLLLHSYNPEYPWTAKITEGVQKVLEKSGLRISLKIEYLDTKDFVFEELRPILHQTLKTKYGGESFNAIMCADDNALLLLLELDEKPFNSVPIIVCGIDSNWQLVEDNRDRITGVFEMGDDLDGLKLALRMYPDSRHFVGIWDTSDEGLLFRESAREQVRNQLYSRDLIELFDLTVEELLEELSKLPDDSVILSYRFKQDRLGLILNDEESYRLITENCDFPFFTGTDLGIELGATGGVVTSGFRQGEEATLRLIRILKGERVEDVQPLEGSPNEIMFNYERLAKAGLKLSDLPDGAIVINQPPSFYQIYRVQIWTGLIFMALQMIAIVLLLLNTVRRRRAEKRLTTATQRLEYLLSSTSAVLFTLDQKEGRFDFISSNCETITGFSPEEFQADPDLWRKRIEPEDTKKWLNSLAETKEKESSNTEYRFLHKNGSVRWIFEGKQKLEHEIAGYFIDRTLSKISEEQMSQMQKMEAVGRLAAGVAHDFNNMLAVITGYSELMLEELSPGEKHFENIQEIKKSADHSADLTRQLLAFSRKQIIKPITVDLNQLISNSEKMLRRLIGESVEIIFYLEPKLKPTRLDPSQLDQILLNLMVNARDAIKGVGKITVETQNILMDEEYCGNQMESKPGEYVMLAVSDTGCGMDVKTVSQVFEPFFSTKNREKGTGLGLATTYGIVKQNGGFIHVYSEPDKGSTFKIYLAAVNDEIPRKNETAKPEDPGGNETILVVEDEESVRKMAAITLERKGYNILQAASPAEAIVISSNYKEMIHLLLTDVVMPGMNGRELLSKLVSVRPEIKSLFMSGYTANVIAHHGVLDPGLSFIQKPFRPKDLSLKIREVLDK